MDNFHPFVRSSFDLGLLLKQLDLSQPQDALLRRLLRELEVHIWFTDVNDDDKTPDNHLAACVWWEGRDGALNLVSKANLADWLRGALVERNIIGDEAEIEALEKLKAVIDEAIAVRRVQSEKTPLSSE
jgi:hypothetical protein